VQSNHDTGLLQQASVDPDKHLSMHPALRASHVQVGILDEFWSELIEVLPLSQNGEFRFTGCDWCRSDILPLLFRCGIDHNLASNALTM